MFLTISLKTMLIEDEKHVFDVTNGKVYMKLKNDVLKEIGIHKNKDGYYQMWYNGKHCLVHRVLYEKAFGAIPNGLFVDHIDRNKTNNKIGNLRLLTRQQNGQNRGKNKNNTSGHKNICWCKHYKKWVVIITVNNKQLRKYFQNLDEAIIYRDEAIARYNSQGNYFST